MPSTSRGPGPCLMFQAGPVAQVPFMSTAAITASARAVTGAPAQCQVRFHPSSQGWLSFKRRKGHSAGGLETRMIAAKPVPLTVPGDPLGGPDPHGRRES